jgi:hypothetical protein
MRMDGSEQQQQHHHQHYQHYQHHQRRHSVFRLESQILQLDDDVEATMGGRDVCPHLQQPLITRAFLLSPSI